LLLLFQTFLHSLGAFRRRFQKHPSFCVCVHTFFNLHMQHLRYITKDTLSPYPCCAKKLFPLGSRSLNQMDRRVCCRADEIWYVWDPTQSRSKALTDVGRWVPGGG
jgi:hypothetical protein